MRIALCFSGQPRFIGECFPSIEDNIINVNKKHSDIDVFMHGYNPPKKDEPYKFGGDGGWKNKRLSINDVESAKNLFNPKLFVFEDPIDFADKRVDFFPSMQKYMPGVENNESIESGLSPKEYSDWLYRNIMRMWYSRREVNILKEKFEAKNNFKYDLVISSRYDVYVNQPLDFQKFDLKKVYVPKMGKPDDELADWMAFSNSDWMNIYNGVFSNAYYHYLWFRKNMDGTFSSERMLWNQLRLHDISVSKISMHLTLPRF